MKKNLLYLSCYVIAVCAISLASCKTEKLVPQQEAVKDITGSWKVVQATRNGTDITSVINFSQFRVVFSDGKYTLQNKLPFLVSQDGTYALDDPQYPFQVSFTAAGGKAVPTTFTYPIVNGVRQLSITFSPGCPNNTYVYVFQKSN